MIYGDYHSSFALRIYPVTSKSNRRPPNWLQLLSVRSANKELERERVD